MAIISRRKPSTDIAIRAAATVTPIRRASAVATTTRRTLRASARPLDLTDKTEGKRLRMARETWQSEAWAYRRSVGELRYAVAFLGNAAQRMRLYPAMVVGDDVVRLDDAAGFDPTVKQACDTALGLLGTGPTGIGPILKAIMENFETAGECYLVGTDDPLTGVRTWKVRSTSETVTNDDGRIGFRDLPPTSWAGTGSSDPNAVEWVDPETTFATRMWWPDPEWSYSADSPVKAVLDILEELLLLGRDVRATARSRIATNGILAFPAELTIVQQNATATDDEPVSLAAELMATASASLSDEGSAAATIPIIVEGPGDLLDKIKHIPIERGTNKTGIADRAELIQRLATGIDLPPEVLTGKAEANHWSAWAISDDTFRDHIEPMVITIVDALTQGYLWPTLAAMGVDPVDISKVFLWYDPTELVTKPDRSKDAIDAYDRDALSAEALRTHLGFTEADAPSRIEILERIILRVRAIDASIQQHILQRFDPTIPTTPKATGEPAPGAPGAPGEPAPATPVEPTTPAAPAAPVEGPPPTQPDGTRASLTRQQRIEAKKYELIIERLFSEYTAGALTAAGDPPPGSTVAEPKIPRVPDDTRSQKAQAANRALVDIDRRLRERLTVASNQTVKTALSRAGARVVSKSRTAAGASLRAAVMDVPQWQIPFAVGPALLAAAGIDETTILDSSLGELRASWDTWVKTGQEQALRTAARLAGLDVNTAYGALAGTFKNDADAGWNVLEKSLRDRAIELLSQPVDDEIEGDSFVASGTIRSALAVAGGYLSNAASAGINDNNRPVDPENPMGQIGTGDTVSDYLTTNGASIEAYQWVHGASANPFEPHEELDGTIFASFTGNELAVPEGVTWGGSYYTPGDHDGCMCDWMPIWTTPDEVLDADTGETLDAGNTADTSDSSGTSMEAISNVASSLISDATEAEPELTGAMTGLADTYGGSMEGLDFRLKSEESLTRKLSADVAETGNTPEQLAAKMFDVNRYTMTFPEEQYVKGSQSVLGDLRAKGYTPNKVKNFWDVPDNPYQGINTQLISPAGQRFELQFHTPESLRVKEGELHHIYEQARVTTDPIRKAELEKEMFEVSGRIPVPRGVTRVQ